MPRKIIKLTESDILKIVKKVIIKEQEEIKNLPTIEFEEAFPDNMINLYNKDKVLLALSNLDNAIEAEKGEERELRSISITIRSGHSPANATNRLPEGFTKPDHNYGGLQGMTMEVCPENKNRTNDGKLCWLTKDNVNSKNNYTRIEDGNVYLAKQRGQKLKLKLEEYLSKKYGAEINIIVDDNIGTDRKFVNAVINGVVYKNPLPELEFSFYIEDIGFESNGVWYVPASPNKVGLIFKNENEKPKTKEEAEKIMQNTVTDRKVLVLDYPGIEKTEYYKNVGPFRPFIEIKNYKKVTNSNADVGGRDTAKSFFYENYPTFKKELDSLQKYKTSTYQYTGNQENTKGAAGFLKRIPPPTK